MLKEEFVPMHFCGVGPRKIKLLADFSVPLQTFYTTWKDRNYTMESKKTRVPKWEVQSISEVASWKPSQKDLSDVHSEHIAAQSWYKE